MTDAAGAAEPLQAPIEICDYDPHWPGRFEREAARIRSALGAAALGLEHVGSTAVGQIMARALASGAPQG